MTFDMLFICAFQIPVIKIKLSDICRVVKRRFLLRQVVSSNRLIIIKLFCFCFFDLHSSYTRRFVRLGGHIFLHHSGLTGYGSILCIFIVVI